MDRYLEFETDIEKIEIKINELDPSKNNHQKEKFNLIDQKKKFT